MNDFETILNRLIKEHSPETFTNGKLGIEKEALRLYRNNISNTKHPRSIGSALCNSYITTDFSESQIELITPPFKNKTKTTQFLDDVHNFVLSNIKDETLWPFSMPPIIKSESDIPIADYGSSSIGVFKKTYRKGLSHRYGRYMQAISGIHYNYSLPDAIWDSFIKEGNISEINNIKSKNYFCMLRNIIRMNWILLYLFGASPAITKNFLPNSKNNFIKLDDQTYYSPYATSLRMSDIGYQNFHRQKIDVSLDSVEKYINDLRKASQTPSEEFKKIGLLSKEDQQISSNIIQIEDEYYAIARVKSEIDEDVRFTAKLEKGGVDYIELRSLDLNPFSRTGIDETTVLFLEVFMVYCFILPSINISNDEENNIRKNDYNVSYFGRKPHLKISRNNKMTSLKNWANEILDQMTAIAEVMDNGEFRYKQTIEKAKIQINDPSQTLSGRLVEKMINEKINFIEMGKNIAEKNKNYYANIAISESNISILEEEVRNSLNNQDVLEKMEQKEIVEFIRGYFK